MPRSIFFAVSNSSPYNEFCAFNNLINLFKWKSNHYDTAWMAGDADFIYIFLINNEFLAYSGLHWLILLICGIGICEPDRIGKAHMKTGLPKYTLGIVVSWYNKRNCNIWLYLWHLSPQSGPFHQFWSFLLILFSKTTQKKSKHYSGRAFLEVFGKCVGLGLSSSFQRPQKC